MDVLMPQLGETVAEGKITKWFVKPGDSVKNGDNLFEIETDKVTVEVPAITAGVITEVRFQVGEVAKVGAVVAVIGGAGAAVSAAPASVPPAPAKPAPSKAPTPFAPAQTRAQGQVLDPRLRGDERNVANLAYPDLDPFFEVRTPTQNFGPARTTGGHSVTPLARRLAAENGINLGSV